MLYMLLLLTSFHAEMAMIPGGSLTMVIKTSSNDRF